MDENIKDAFQKVKQDIESLRENIGLLRDNFSEIVDVMIEVNKKIDNLPKKESSTDNQTIQTDSTDNSTDIAPFKPLKPQYLPISNGNEGVPTDRQTNRQTNRHIENTHKIFENIVSDTQKKDNSFDDAIGVLDSLDSIKKEIRLKFKRLTEQELMVFSTMYQLDEELGHSDYKLLSERLNLTESSIRDYVGRLIKKGIPVDKNKINNKSIQLNISENLKKIASLSTILQLRDL